MGGEDGRAPRPRGDEVVAPLHRGEGDDREAVDRLEVDAVVVGRAVDDASLI